MDRPTYVAFVAVVSLSATAYLYGIIAIWAARIRRRLERRRLGYQQDTAPTPAHEWEDFE